MQAIRRVVNGQLQVVAGILGTSGTPSQKRLTNPWGVAVMGRNIYIADRGNHAIQVVDATGALSLLAGSNTGNVLDVAVVWNLAGPATLQCDV
jgi:hypothetical protein